MKKIIFLSILFTILLFGSITNFELLENYYFNFLNILWFPILGIVNFGIIFYIKLSYKSGMKTPFRLAIVLSNVLFIWALLQFGFTIWSTNQGNIIPNVSNEFVLNANNIIFWSLYQGVLLALPFSILKQLVTIGQK